MTTNFRYRNQDEPIAEYQEFHYPYVHPDDDITESVNDGELNKLTPLERVFVQWLLRTDDPERAVESLMRPAFPFDTTVSTGRAIRARPTVSDAINKIRKKFPYLSKYTIDYTLSLLHDEVEYLRARNRRKRYTIGSDWLSWMCNGKKSVHEEEIADMNLLLQYLQLIRELTTVSNEIGTTVPGTQPRDTNSSVNRVLAEAKRQISGREDGPGGPTGPGAP